MISSRLVGFFVATSLLVSWTRGSLGGIASSAGLTNEEKQLLLRVIPALKSRSAAFSKEFRTMESFHHGLTVARLTEQHMFVYGPAGGAKSAAVQWFFNREPSPAFQLQMNKMTPETAIVGGLDFEAAKRGEYKVNTKGSLADFEWALIDEINNANSMSLQALYRPMNERKILAGGLVIDCLLKTLVSTANGYPYDIKEQFIRDGQLPEAADAFLSRFLFKTLAFNWLPEVDQEELDRSRAASDCEAHSGSMGDDVTTSQCIPWDELRQFARTRFKPSESYWGQQRKLVNSMRRSSIAAHKKSVAEMQYSRDPGDLPFLPTADYNERLRRQLAEVVRMSLVVDLLSSASDPQQFIAELELLLNPGKAAVEFDELSLWRLYLVLTTIYPGQTSLSFEVPASEDGQDVGVAIAFGPTILPEDCGDAREVKQIGYIREEQARFSDAYKNVVVSKQEGHKAYSILNYFTSSSGVANENLEKLIAIRRTK